MKGETVGGGADGLFKMAQGFVGLRVEEGGRRGGQWRDRWRRQQLRWLGQGRAERGGSSKRKVRPVVY